ncbi:TonB-linked outer membrane protein, SusC/RagA family [bacterium A37T11]|nr:TonB-linked outer membrane protein, SusC/RagA family [bacterium A37T11]
MNYKDVLPIAFFSLLTMVAYPQNGRTAGGTVISQSDHAPLEGVTIQSKLLHNKSFTDKNGHFTIRINVVPDTLVFSFVGFETERVPLSKATTGTLIISLKPTSVFLDEAEVRLNTGISSISKLQATGSFSHISNKLFNEQVGTNVLDRLKYISNGVVEVTRQGVLNGQILIRGFSTFSQSIQKPLIILDNFEYQGDLNNINPNEVSDVTILKDAAASAIWGAKAGNGVIVITTKKARLRQKPTIAFSSNVSFVEKPDLFQLKSMSTSDLIDVEQYLFSQKYRFADTARFNHPAFTPVYEILFDRLKGKISEETANSQIDELRNIDARKAYEDIFYRGALNQQYALSFQAGSDKSTLVASAGIDRNTDEHYGTYHRLNLRIANTYQVSRKIAASADVLYTHSNSTQGRPSYGTIRPASFDLPLYTRFRDDAGTDLPAYIYYRQGYIDTIGAGKLLDWRYFPSNDFNNLDAISIVKDLHAVAGLTYKPLPWLNLDIKYRHELQQVDGNNHYGEESYFVRDLVNGYSQLVNGNIMTPVPQGDILDLNNHQITAKNLRGQLNIAKTWVNHDVTALLGTESSETISSSNSYRTYGYDPAILTYKNVDFANNYPHYILGSRIYIPDNRNFIRTNTRFLSFYGNGAYTFRKKYTLSMSARRDASNLFGVKTNDKWKPLWSLGGSYDISKEPFYHVLLIPYLKIRLSYGKQGNIDPSMVAVTTMSYRGTNPYLMQPYAQIDNRPNPELKWEEVSMLNAGLDFGSKDSRVTGSFDYFRKRMSDLYASVPMDKTTGVSSIIRNVGNGFGQGFDLELNTRNLSGPLTWNSSLNFSYFTANVLNNGREPSELASDYVIGAGGLRPGYPFYGMFAFPWAGLSQADGSPMGYLNGEVSTDYNEMLTNGKVSDLKYVGSAHPEIYGSLGNQLNWDNFSLAFRLTFKFNYFFKRESISYSGLVSRLSGHSDYTLRWQRPGDESITDVPSFQYPAPAARDQFYQNAEILVNKGDHIRFQYINISYTLRAKDNPWLPVNNLNIFLVANNLGIVWRANKLGLDPDYPELRPSRTLSIGLNLTY